MQITLIKEEMLRPGLYQKVHYILCIAIAMCFIGHGSFGIITKPIWCNYFAVFGIGHDLSYTIMPVVGCIDIVLGVLMLVYPVRAFPAWLVVWGIFTALLRPLSGEPFAEFIERSGNFGAPLALLLLSGGSKTFKGWFTRIDPNLQPHAATYARLTVCLRVIVFFLLLGHGWLNMMAKKNLLQQYAGLGFSSPEQVAQVTGVAEIIFAVVVLFRPLRPVLFAICIWKMGTELFYPHYGLLEWIERAGSYGTVLALWVITKEGFGEGYFSVKSFLPGSFNMYHNKTV